MNKHTLSNFYTIFLINLPFLLLKVKVLVAQLFLILCDPMDCSWSGSSVHGILQARSRSELPFPPLGDLLDPGIEPGSSALQADCLPSEPSRKPKCFIFSHWSLILDPNPCSRSIVTWLGMEVRKLTEKMKVEMKVKFISFGTLSPTSLFLCISDYLLTFELLSPFFYHLSSLLVLAQMGTRRFDLEHRVGWLDGGGVGMLQSGGKTCFYGWPVHSRGNSPPSVLLEGTFENYCKRD